MRRRALRWLFGGLALLCAASSAGAHEVRPAVLDIREVGERSYAVSLRLPVRDGEPLAVSLRHPDHCTPMGPPARERERDWLTVTSALACERDLRGERLEMPGLDATLTDMLVGFTGLDGGTATLRATPGEPSVTLPARADALGTMATYASLGFGHILEGWDHLAFVFMLLLLVRGWATLVKAVTAFTLAHSITLAAAVLGVAGLPPGPVETVIALSIALLAAEVIRTGPETLARRAPWLVAFAFGLLHGFGFAGALAEIGLPDGQVPLALLSFNIGIEAGQLAFVAAVGLLLVPLSRVGWRPRADRVMAYGVGAVATAWTLERALAL